LAQALYVASVKHQIVKKKIYNKKTFESQTNK